MTVPIRVDVTGAIASVTLHRPEKRNAMTLAMWTELGRIFTALSADKAIRGVILKGAGDSFSVGADVSEFDAVRGDADAAKAYEIEVDACADAIAACPKPTVAAINGYCLGGGCHLALACDFRLGSSAASIGIPAAKLSIVYGLKSTQRLLALVGLSSAKQILYSGRRYAAGEALSIGLIDDVCDDVAVGAAELLAGFSENAPLSIAGAKDLLTELTMRPGQLDEARAQFIIDQAADSADYREGRAAFAEKRKPQFKGH